jgi:hypothetical protein
VLCSSYHCGKVRYALLTESSIISLPVMLSNNPYVVIISDGPKANAAFLQHEKKLTLGRRRPLTLYGRNGHRFGCRPTVR